MTTLRRAPTIVPLAAAIAALLFVLPRTGADATVRIDAGPQGERATFRPATLELEAGDRVAFENRTTRTHTATCPECPWSSGDIQPGETEFVTFPEPGRFQLVCRYHPDADGERLQIVVSS